MKYNYKNNTEFKKTRDEVIIEYCKGKKVLHIGATDSPFTEEKFNNNLLLHCKINSVTNDLLGIDIDQDSINYLRNKGYNNIITFDMNNLMELEFMPDIIIFGETIEHLLNLEIALTNIKRIMKNDTKLIISTPNAMWINKIINTLFSFEDQHIDHKIIFSYATLSNLFRVTGFKLEKVYFTFLNRKHEGISKYIKKSFCHMFNGFSETILAVVSLNENN